jgi:hypothetical protein
MNDNRYPQPSLRDALDRLAMSLRRRGLATPALMLIQMARPLGFLGGQCLLLLQPIMPVQGWQAGLVQTARLLEDETAWNRLENLLQ